MPFTQNFHGTVHNVYNVEGSLILDSRSGREDLERELAKLRAAVAGLPELPEADRRSVETELAAAQAQSASPKPDGAAIKTHLDKAGTTLESATNVVAKAGAFAKTVFGIGTWAFAQLS